MALFVVAMVSSDGLALFVVAMASSNGLALCSRDGVCSRDGFCERWLGLRSMAFAAMALVAMRWLLLRCDGSLLRWLLALVAMALLAMALGLWAMAVFEQWLCFGGSDGFVRNGSSCFLKVVCF